MTTKQDMITELVKYDVSHIDKIQRFLSVYHAVAQDRGHLVHGSVGHDVLALFEGLKIPSTLVRPVNDLSKAKFNTYMPFLQMIIDPNQKEDWSEKKYGVILSSTPDFSRTRAIGRWSDKSAFALNPRGAGFTSAIELLGGFGSGHIEAYRLYTRYLGIDYDHTPMLMKVESIDDWEGVWKIYNKLVYGHNVMNAETSKYRERSKRVGLHDKSVFAEVLRDSNIPYPAIAALDVVMNGLAHWY